MFSWASCSTDVRLGSTLLRSETQLAKSITITSWLPTDWLFSPAIPELGEVPSLMTRPSTQRKSPLVPTGPSTRGSAEFNYGLAATQSSSIPSCPPVSLADPALVHPRSWAWLSHRGCRLCGRLSLSVGSRYDQAKQMVTEGAHPQCLLGSCGGAFQISSRLPERKMVSPFSISRDHHNTANSQTLGTQFRSFLIAVRAMYLPRGKVSLTKLPRDRSHYDEGFHVCQ